MILLLDLGNSRIKWALADHGAFLVSGVVQDPADLASAWEGLPAASRALGCSVSSPEIQAGVAAQIALRWQITVEWLQVLSRQAGVRNRYDEPARLGADRWAALLGARARVPDRALVVVSAGTALVVDALTADGDFLGGMILPGYRLMKQALASGTARLPVANGHFVPFPTSTDDAIETGCLSALSGAISAMAERLASAGQHPIQILISGGDASLLQPLLNGQIAIMDNLALSGLLTVATIHEGNPQ
ncbi:MAG: type III pantothenate kinase [Formivibrio sp.]|nr:type III pantothenate kinase [Formivibrio sp.]